MRIGPAFVLIVTAWASPAPTQAAPALLRVEVVSVRPHDPSAFTQGLRLHQGWLYESTGRYGESTLRRVDPATGTIVDRVELAADVFAEGLELVDDKLLQLTWKEQRVFVWAVDGFHELDELTYAGEGWGLCYDGAQLLMSDGSNRLAIRDPVTFEMLDTLDVTLDGLPLDRLNELECVDDRVYANVWETDEIVVIDRNTGVVSARIDASGLLDPDESDDADVLNGIAYDRESERFLITGKLWPKLFEVRFVTDNEVEDTSEASEDTGDTSERDIDVPMEPMLGCDCAVSNRGKLMHALAFLLLVRSVSRPARRRFR